MRNEVSLYEESKRLKAAGLNAFYAPQFEIRIEGADLPRDVLHDVIQLTYTDSIQQIDSFELTVNNWDTEANAFKYIGAETQETVEQDTPEGRRYRLFEPCTREVEVRMGYAGELRTMLTGRFTTMEPTFPRSAAPTLTVRGLNKLHDLRRKQYTEPWVGKRDSEIAEAIGNLFDREAQRKRFPLRVQIDENAKQEEPVLPYLAQHNQYDIDFLLTRARQRGYVVFVQEPDEEAGRDESTLYFGPSQGGTVDTLRNVTFELEWGKSLMDFKPTLTTANQVRAVNVQGWDRRRRRQILESATTNDLRSPCNSDLHRLLGCDEREVKVVREPVYTATQAKQRAVAILRERQKEMVKASGTTIGLPDLRAGRYVHIKGIGSRFSGPYFITETTHTIDDNGYITRFKARREACGRQRGNA